MKQRQFEIKHQQLWLDFEKQLNTLENNTAKKDQVEISSFPQHYRLLCHQYALAQERAYSLSLQQQLNSLIARGHRQLYRFNRPIWASLTLLLAQDFPRRVRQHWRWQLAAALAFIGPLILAWALVANQEEMIYAMMDQKNVTQIEWMYDPDSDIRDHRQAGDDVTMFGYYIYNNIGIAFRTFASGLFIGIGSLFILVFNGSFFGAIAAHLINVGSHQPFFTFVVAHGAPELTAIVLSGGAGFRLGWSLLSPGPYRRLHALKLAAQETLPIIYGCFFLLLSAAFIEAFWSPRQFPAEIKYGVGALSWLLVFTYLAMAGRARQNQ